MAKVVTEFDVELAKWQAKIAQIKADMKGAKSAAKEVKLGDELFGKLKDFAAPLTAGASVAGIKAIMNEMDDLADLASKLGESPEVLQKVGQAAERLASVDINGVAASMLKLERALGDVENTAGRDALAHYGLSAEQLMSLPLDEKILALSGAFQKARDEGTGLADLQDLMGRSAADLIPLFEASGAEIRGYFESTAVVADEAVYQIAALNDEFDHFVENMKTKAKGGVIFAKELVEALGAGIMSSFGDDRGITQLVNARVKAMEEAESKLAQQEDRRRTRAKAMQSNLNGAVQAEALAEQSKIDREAERAAKEEADRQAKIAKMQDEIAMGQISLLPSEEKIAAMEDRLITAMQKAGDAYGQKIDPTLENLLNAAEKIDGSFEGDQAFLDAVREVQKAQKELDDTKAQAADKEVKQETTSVRTARTPGALAGAINLVFGRSQNELIMDEAKQQTQQAKETNRLLGRIEQLLKDPNKRTAMGGAFPELFAP